MTKKLKYLSRTLLSGPYLALCRDEASFIKECKRLNIKNIPPWVSELAHATTHFFYHSDDGQCIIVCISEDKKRTKTAIYALLVHEAVHVVRARFRHMNEDKPGEEIEAYCIQNIAQTLMEAYDDRK